MLDRVRGAGGDVIAIVGQGQGAADDARELWKLDFESWSDSGAEIATHWNDSGMAAVEIDEAYGASFGAAPAAMGGRYEVGVLQPAVVVVPKGQPEGQPLLSWSSVPSAWNIGGAAGRPSALETVHAIDEVLSGASAPKVPWEPASTVATVNARPLLHFVDQWAHGNFIRPKGFGFPGAAKRPMQRLKAAAVFGGSALLGASRPKKLGLPIVGAYVAWLMYVYVTHGAELQAKFKYGTFRTAPRPIKFAARL